MLIQKITIQLQYLITSIQDGDEKLTLLQIHEEKPPPAQQVSTQSTDNGCTPIPMRSVWDQQMMRREIHCKISKSMK